ncbi:hypothetical protein ADUPG1_006496 [Aduncisulcus paluster]|uniref:Uncharacterized protein n=1 Tax=Aduncisulcus paluster TaxID=2918883 RepID=A0ABQ5KIG3_9EUKA|nr:hypothetical protein ADUPG1_006496 [Aduncisulcus paluster]
MVDLCPNSSSGLQSDSDPSKSDVISPELKEPVKKEPMERDTVSSSGKPLQTLHLAQILLGETSTMQSRINRLEKKFDTLCTLPHSESKISEPSIEVVSRLESTVAQQQTQIKELQQMLTIALDEIQRLKRSVVVNSAHIKRDMSCRDMERVLSSFECGAIYDRAQDFIDDKRKDIDSSGL